jgi:hypothetical protein
LNTRKKCVSIKLKFVRQPFSGKLARNA